MFHRAKRTLRQRWKLLLVMAVMGPGVLALLWFFPPITGEKVDSAGVAAWVQGVGTVLAVLAAAWIARDQFDWQQAAETRRRQAEQLIELTVVRDALAELSAAISVCTEAADNDAADAYWEVFGPRGSFDLQHLTMLVKLVHAVPLSAMYGPALHLALYKARDFGEGALDHIKLFSEEARGAASFDRRALHHSLRACDDGVKAAETAFREQVAAREALAIGVLRV